MLFQGWCRGEPITQAGKRRQVVKMLLLILVPIIALLCVSAYFLADGVNEKRDTDRVSARLALYNVALVLMLTMLFMLCFLDS